MELPQELDDFIKNSIDHTCGISVPNESLQLKVQSLETSNFVLRNQYLTLLSKLKQKEQALELAKGEACMNAQAIKKFVEENQKLAAECANLVNQCSKLERECSLYDHDREALMEFGNESDERAKEAEIRASELDEELKQLNEEVNYYKHQCEMLSDDSSKDGAMTEQKLLNTLVASLVNKNEVAKTASAFLEANSEVETCHELLTMLSSLRPETQNVLSLAAHVRTLQQDKDHLTINLHRAEEEVKVLFEENHVLDVENKRLLKLYKSEKKHANSGGKHDSSARTKVRDKLTLPYTITQQPKEEK
ncbi:uncharacterized protein [Spinacia oleracea]|uniref:Uncharacterized protein isoform X2 n=1 Tax=Spinacia oleracea TaxID=3562 RepID=A0A9R0KAS7_SPIOL|nr:uncharacterized protein LOC110803518 isoform X2 [Spinacia oleracea]